MFDLSLKCHRDSFKTAMRMSTHASWMTGRLKVSGWCVVKHEKGGEFVGEGFGCKYGMNVKSISNPVTGGLG
jgi:hypothetical protein